MNRKNLQTLGLFTGSCLVLLGLSWCTAHTADTDSETRITGTSSVGRCTIEEPPLPSTGGHSTYTVLPASPTMPGPSRPGAYGATLVCVTPGTTGDRVGIFLPNLVSAQVPEGTYHVVDPTDTTNTPQSADQWTAWAIVSRTPSTPLLYHGVAGSVHLKPETDEKLLSGSYQIAFARDSTSGTAPNDQLVLGGAFVAPQTPQPTHTAKQP